MKHFSIYFSLSIIIFSNWKQCLVNSIKAETDCPERIKLERIEKVSNYSYDVSYPFLKMR